MTHLCLGNESDNIKMIERKLEVNTCHICDLVSHCFELRDLDPYIFAQHNCKKRFLCDICQAEFGNDENFQLHNYHEHKSKANSYAEHDSEAKQINNRNEFINIEEPLNINVIIEKDLAQVILGYGSNISNPGSVTNEIFKCDSCAKDFDQESEAFSHRQSCGQNKSIEDNDDLGIEVPVQDMKVVLGKAVISKFDCEEIPLNTDERENIKCGKNDSSESNKCPVSVQTNPDSDLKNPVPDSTNSVSGSSNPIFVSSNIEIDLTLDIDDDAMSFEREPNNFCNTTKSKDDSDEALEILEDGIVEDIQENNISPNSMNIALDSTNPVSGSITTICSSTTLVSDSSNIDFTLDANNDNHTITFDRIPEISAKSKDHSDEVFDCLEDRTKVTQRNDQELQENNQILISTNMATSRAQISDSRNQVHDSSNPVSDSRNIVPDSSDPVPDSSIPVFGSSNPVPDSSNPVSGSSNSDSSNPFSVSSNINIANDDHTLSIAFEKETYSICNAEKSKDQSDEIIDDIIEEMQTNDQSLQENNQSPNLINVYFDSNNPVSHSSNTVPKLSNPISISSNLEINTSLDTNDKNQGIAFEKEPDSNSPKSSNSVSGSTDQFSASPNIKINISTDKNDDNHAITFVKEPISICNTTKSEDNSDEVLEAMEDGIEKMQTNNQDLHMNDTYDKELVDDNVTISFDCEKESENSSNNIVSGKSDQKLSDFRHSDKVEYFCDICKKSCLGKVQLDQHIRNFHISKLNTVCDFCDKLFRDLTEKKAHFNKFHKEERIFKCDFCQNRLLNSKSLSEHIKRKHFKVSHYNLKCDECNRSFHRKSLLNQHKTITHPTCPRCEKQFEDKNAFNIHFKKCSFTTNKSNSDVPIEAQNLNDKVNENEYLNNFNQKCCVCYETFDSLDLLSSHIKKNHKSVLKKTFNRCFICNEISFNFNEMTKHIKSTHDIKFNPLNSKINHKKGKSRLDLLPIDEVSAQNFKCQECEVIFPELAGLEFHNKCLHAFQCGLCKDRFGSQILLDDHVISKHNCHNSNSNKSKVAAKANPKRNKSILVNSDTNHIPILENQDSPENSKVTMDSEKVENSETINDTIQKDHTEKGNKSTNFCGICKENLEQSSLTHLEKVHLIQEEYKCIQCKKKFPYHTSKMIHMRVKHREVKMPFKCDFCKKKFSKILNLKHHMKLHQDLLNCKFCDKAFGDLVVLAKHKLSSHDVIELFECTKCHSKHENLSNFLNHIRLQHARSILYKQRKRHFSMNNLSQEKMYECFQCKAYLEGPKNLQEHIKIVHISQQNLTCEYCGKISQKIGWNKQHLKGNHDQDRPYKCDFCVKRFYNSSHLQEHIELVHFMYNRRTISKRRNSFHSQESKRGKDKNSELDSSLVQSVKESHVPKYDNIMLNTEENETVSQETPQSLLNQDIETYNCQKCKITFQIDDIFVKHLKRWHILAKNTTCGFCDQEFDSAEENKTHIQDVHKTDKFFDCDFCEKRFHAIKDLSEHVLTFHFKMFEFNCNTCCKWFLNKELLQNHNNLEHKKEATEKNHTQDSNAIGTKKYSFICNICKLDMKSFNNLLQHTKLMHSVPLLIQDSISENNENVQNKVTTVSEMEITYKVNSSNSLSENLPQNRESEKQFNEQPELTMPQDEVKKELTCEKCNKSFSSIGNLNNHKKHIHDRLKIYKCHRCEKSFNTKFSFKRHLENHSMKRTKRTKRSEKKNFKNFKCEICSNTFSYPNSLRLHQRTIHSDYAFKCMICEKSFVQKVALKGHLLRIHLQKMEDVTASLKNLKPTKKNGGLEQNHKEKNVDSTSVLNEEAKCDLCAKSFFNIGNLNMHKKTVHLNYIFKCHICNVKTFSHKVSLRKHLVKAHKQDSKAVLTLTKKLKPIKAMNSTDQDLLNNALSTNILAVRNNVETIVNSEKDTSTKPMAEANGSPILSENTVIQVNNYKCESCIQSFTSQTELAVHIIEVHVKDSLNLQN